jgi:hypothetical protein
MGQCSIAVERGILGHAHDEAFLAVRTQAAV